MDGSPSERLAALGIGLPAVVAPVAAYLPSIRAGAQVWTSGQLPFVDGALLRTGVVGNGPDDVSIEDAALVARVALLTAIASAAGAAGGVSHQPQLHPLPLSVPSPPDPLVPPTASAAPRPRSAALPNFVKSGLVEHAFFGALQRAAGRVQL